MIYSVWNWDKNNFTYYKSEADYAKRAMPLGSEPLAPEEAAVELPKDAVQVGEGEDARGMIAVIEKPKTGIHWVIAGGFLIAAYGLYRIWK